MPDGKRSYKRLTPTERCEIYDMVSSGQVSARQAAEDFGVSYSTVKTLVRKFRDAEEHEEARMGRGKIVAGNKHDGQLVMLDGQRDTYEGSCLLDSGKFARKRFHATGDITAQHMWEAWCKRTREKEEEEPARHALVDMAPEDVADEPEMPNDVEPSEIKPPVLEVGFFDRVQDAIDRGVGDSAVDDLMSRPTYLVYLKGEVMKAVGQTTSFEKAMSVCDERNAALSFAGFDPMYEVLEVPWLES